MCLALWNWRLLHHAILSLPDRLDDLRHGFVAGLISDQARELRNDLPTHFTASAAWLIRCFTVSSCWRATMIARQRVFLTSWHQAIVLACRRAAAI